MIILPKIRLATRTLTRLVSQNVRALFLAHDNRFQKQLRKRFPAGPTVQLTRCHAMRAPFNLTLTRQLITKGVTGRQTLLRQHGQTAENVLNTLSRTISTVTTRQSALSRARAPLDHRRLVKVRNVYTQTCFRKLHRCFSPH